MPKRPWPFAPVTPLGVARNPTSAPGTALRPGSLEATACPRARYRETMASSDTPETRTQTARLPASARIGRVFLRCRDLEGCVTFYRGALGLDLFERTSDLALLGAGDRALIGLIASPYARAAGRVPGLYHLALLVPDRASLGAFLAHAVQARVSLQGAADHGVSEAIYLADPEGNGIEVYRDRPREAWPMRGERVAMGTGPLDGEGLLVEAPSAGGFRAPAGTSIGHVHLRVSDVKSAAPRYRDDLGLDVMQDDFPGARFLSAGGYHHHIGLNEWETRGAPPRPAGALGLAWFELVMPDERVKAAATERVRSAWTAAEAVPGMADVPGGIRPWCFVDQDGIAVALVDTDLVDPEG